MNGLLEYTQNAWGKLALASVGAVLALSLGPIFVYLWSKVNHLPVLSHCDRLFCYVFGWKQPKFIVGCLLLCIPFLVALAGWEYMRNNRVSTNPKDKGLPSFTEMYEGFTSYAFEEDPRTGNPRLASDAEATLYRLGWAWLITISVGLAVGLPMGVYPVVDWMMYIFTLIFEKIPALALTSILFAIVGVEDQYKITVITLGVLPTVILDIRKEVRRLDPNYFYQSLSLGASRFEIPFRQVLPRIWPDILHTVRINLKSSVILLIAAEWVVTNAGMGFRINQLGTRLRNDIVLPYALLIVLFVFLVDFGIYLGIRLMYPWHKG